MERDFLAENSVLGVYVSDPDEMYDPEMADGCDMEAKIHQYAQEWVVSEKR